MPGERLAAPRFAFFRFASGGEGRTCRAVVVQLLPAVERDVPLRHPLGSAALVEAAGGADGTAAAAPLQGHVLSSQRAAVCDVRFTVRLSSVQEFWLVGRRPCSADLPDSVPPRSSSFRASVDLVARRPQRL